MSRQISFAIKKIWRIGVMNSQQNQLPVFLIHIIITTPPPTPPPPPPLLDNTNKTLADNQLIPTFWSKSLRTYATNMIGMEISQHNLCYTLSFYGGYPCLSIHSVALQISITKPWKIWMKFYWESKGQLFVVHVYEYFLNHNFTIPQLSLLWQ